MPGALLRRLRERLATVEPFDAAGTETAVKLFLEQEGLKIGDIIHALRVAVTGKAVGLGMFDALEILGRDQVLDRIDRTLGNALRCVPVRRSLDGAGGLNRRGTNREPQKSEARIDGGRTDGCPEK